MVKVKVRRACVAVIVGLQAALFVAGNSAEAQVQAKRPNIVVILADDMGFADMGSFGSETGIYIVGDSIADETTVAHVNWTGRLGTPSFTNAANGLVGAVTLVSTIQPTYAADLAALDAGFGIAIIQGGVNDFAGDNSLANVQTALTSMVTSAKAAGFTVIVCGIAPWKNDPAWSAARQTKTDDYNTWLAAQDTVQGFTYVDVYTPLEDDITADALEADYDNGDGIHLNVAGDIVYAAQVEPVITPLLSEASMTANYSKNAEPRLARQ